ncbi:hypothetical protein NDI56_10355 [Haloarcula sp. S1CR25-12]|uniref:EamA family transporter n=1 Tax=Haloarcula saliterrae TaxID=2950534 RepID=A0ABU2FC65_9EURY|nr:hypothetical protein [Haloarcula sp. S1CR25-12]MDS0259792.1 hypothetical protein [Haloarcula sp. S1CR25-12]
MSRFVSVLIIVGFAIATQVSPPGVSVQLLAALRVLMVVLPFSYWLVYVRGLSLTGF